MNSVHLHRRDAAAAIVVAVASLGVCAAGLASEPRDAAPTFSRLSGGYSPTEMSQLERSMDPGMVGLAQRMAATRPASVAGRPEGWGVLDIANPPRLDFGAMTALEAEKINAFLPASGDGAGTAAPFRLEGSSAERQRALLCLTQAIYYEAALEPVEGQEAVAQTVLNRVRNPAFPHSVCGVVYQGSQAVTGCQFSFTCDGSRERPPIAPFWQNAQAVAARALGGFVLPSVGTATHYHADYVFPAWGPTLVKIEQIGAHIFYRFPGPLGAAPSFREPYAGGELRVSMAGPSRAAILAAKAAGQFAQVGGAGSGETRPVQIAYADASSPDGLRQRVAGEVVFGRRVPTKAEIARINAALSAMEQPAATDTAARAAAAPAATKAAPQAATTSAQANAAG